MLGSRPLTLLTLALSLLGVVSCTGKVGDRKETVPVKGEVFVDGTPVEGLKVICNDDKGMDTARPSVSQCFTGKDGKFAISTYEAGDGVPPGNYELTFLWGQFNMSMQYGGPDRLNDRYSISGKSAHKFTISPGDKPLELGRIDLTTK